jgi:salicylate hydroxylase
VKAPERLTHEKILEKSTFKTEVGAALNLLPNGSVVLGKLGFDFERALVGRHQRMEVVNGTTLETLTLVDLSNTEKTYGSHVQSVLRADLHSELFRLSQEGPNPASLHLGSQVKRVDSATGTVELESGEVYAADLIIGADGSHSVCRREVLGYEQSPIESGKSAFRFLIPTNLIEDDESTKKFIRGKSPGANIFVDVGGKLRSRTLTWYECHGYVQSALVPFSKLIPGGSGMLQNFVGVFDSELHVESISESFPKSTSINVRSCLHTSPAQKPMLLEQFQHFHPHMVNMLEYAKIFLASIQCKVPNEIQASR